MGLRDEIIEVMTLARKPLDVSRITQGGPSTRHEGRVGPEVRAMADEGLLSEATKVSCPQAYYQLAAKSKKERIA